jgi:hypothetical protein
MTTAMTPAAVAVTVARCRPQVWGQILMQMLLLLLLLLLLLVVVPPPVAVAK